jgi:hypothetical protein
MGLSMYYDVIDVINTSEHKQLQFNANHIFLRQLITGQIPANILLQVVRMCELDKRTAIFTSTMIAGNMHSGILRRRIYPTLS